MSNYGKRMVRESKIKEIGQGGSGTNVSGTNDGTNWTSLTIDDDTYGIPQGSDSTKVYGIKLKDICEKYGRTVGLKYVTKQELIENGLPILTTNVATQSSYPYKDLVIDVPTGESNGIILEGIFGVARGNDVELFRTNGSEGGNESAVYAWRNGSEDWMLKNTRWHSDKTVGNYVPTYEAYDFSDVNTYFGILNQEVGLYYYDSDNQQYVTVGSGTYDPDVNYYTESLGNYFPAPITPEAYFKYYATHMVGYIYTKNGDSYEKITDPDAYDPTQTYYVTTAVTDTIHMAAPSNEGNLGVSSKAQNQLINVFQTYMMVNNPVVNTRYGTQLTVPAVQGTYTLKVTVDSEGHPTFSWVADATE